MTRYLLCLALLATTVEAQIAPCGNATCVGNSPGDVNLGGTLLETRGARPDGGVAILQPVVAGASLVLQSIKPTGTPGTPDVIIRSSNVHDGGTILSVRSGNTELFAVTPAGVTGSQTTGSFGFIDGGTALIGGCSFTGSGAETCTGTVQGNDLQVPTNRGVYLNGTTRTVGFSSDNATSVRLLGALPLTAASDQNQNLGTAAVRWSNIYATDLHLNGTTTSVGSCTLNGASPSVCTATVNASTKCTCSPVGASAAIAAGGCAVGLASTTLTITSANGLTNDVNYHCF